MAGHEINGVPVMMGQAGDMIPAPALARLRDAPSPAMAVVIAANSLRESGVTGPIVIELQHNDFTRLALDRGFHEIGFNGSKPGEVTIPGLDLTVRSVR